MYFLCVAALVVAIVVVVNLRRSRFGRVLIALRENEANVQSFGVSAVRTKLRPSRSPARWPGSPARCSPTSSGASAVDSFVPQRSVDLFLLAVLGGVGRCPARCSDRPTTTLTHVLLPGQRSFCSGSLGAAAALLL